ncbi:MAG TPA: efflux RND transporter periplasmic adaptor subunit [Myxococcota bacterium]
MRRPSGRRAAVLVLLTLAACERGGPDMGNGPPPLPVQVVTAGAQMIPRSIEAVGSLESPDPTQVSAEVSGAVVFTDIAEGRRVAAGHVLVRLDDAQLRARAAESRARYRQAQDRLRRTRSLREQGVASAEALDDALAENDAAAAALEEAENQLSKSSIRAPFEGVLGMRQVSLGQYLEEGDPVVRVTQIDPLDLVFSVPQRHANEVALGQRAFGVIDRCEGHFEGEVMAIEPRLDPVTRMLRVKARVPNSDGTLAPGMAVRLRLVVEEIPDAVVLPQETIVRQGTKQVVYVVDGESRAHLREVTLGQFFSDGVHVTQGVAPGDVVVAAGHQKLRPGAPVQPQPRKETRNPLLELGWFGPPGDCEP